MLDSWYLLLDQDDQDLTDGLHQAELEERLWNKIQQEIQPNPIPLRAPEPRFGWLGSTRIQWVAAASILLIGGLGYFTFLNPILRQEGLPPTFRHLFQSASGKKQRQNQPVGHSGR